MAENVVRQRLAAILAADVAGYSRLMGDDERATIDAINRCRAIFREHIEANGGRVVDMAGDSVLAIFDTAIGAFTTAMVSQEQLTDLNTKYAEDRRMLWRIGVNLGDIHEQDDGTVYGDGVNVAARLEALAEPGGACVSGKVRDELRGKIDRSFADLGEHEVKNIAEPVRAYRVLAEGERVPIASGPRRRRLILAGAAVVVLALIVAFLWPADHHESPVEVVTAAPHDPTPALPSGPSIAVLPFTNMSEDPDQEYFSDGISEDLITELSRFEGLLVVARNSTFRFKGQAVDITEVAAALGVRYVLEGSVRRTGDRVRVTAQLIDSETGGHLWAERYDRQMTDIFAVQDDVTGQIIAALKSELGNAIPSRANRPLTSSQEAYDLYLRGRANHNRRTRETNALAQDLFEQAVGLDATFAAAYAALSHAQVLAWIYGWAEGPAALENAEEAARRAVTIDPSLPQGHAQLGWVLTFRGRLDEGIAAARHATALDTNYATGYTYLSVFLSLSGEGAEALAAGNVAVRLDPFAFNAQLGRGLAQLILRDYEKAAANFQTSLEINPDFGAGHQYLAAAYGLLGREEEARAEAAEALSISPDFADVILGLPFRNRADLMMIVDGLRKAGLDVPDPPSAN